jgi:transposase
VRVTTAFNRLLRLDGASVAAVEIGDDGVVVDLRRHRRRRVECPCGYTSRAFYDRTTRRWRHLDMAGTQLWLRAEIRRLVCPTCGVRTERVAWARPGSRFTIDFEDLVAWLAQRSAKSTVAELMRCSWESVDRIVTSVVAEHLDDSRWDGLVHLGVDEIAYRNGHRYLTVVVDHDTNRVVWAVEGRTKEALAGFYAALGEQRCAEIEAVSMDMTTIYRSITEQTIPHAAICLDPFHVMQWVNQALDSVYKSAPRSDLDGSISGLEWRRTRTALRTGAEHLNDDQRTRVNRLRRRRNQLWRAWELKEQFRDLYRNTPPEHAADYLEHWCTCAMRSKIGAFVTLARRIRKHFGGIINAVTYGLSNSRVEGVNAKIRLINNRAHGHKSAPALIASIYLTLGGITIQLPTGR